MCQSLFWKSKQVVSTSSFSHMHFYLLEETLIYYLSTILPSWNHTPLSFHASVPLLQCSHMTSTACPMSFISHQLTYPLLQVFPASPRKKSPSCLLTPGATSLEACNIVIYIFVFSSWWFINSFMSGTFSNLSIQSLEFGRTLYMFDKLMT